MTYENIQLNSVKRHPVFAKKMTDNIVKGS